MEIIEEKAEYELFLSQLEYSPLNLMVRVCGANVFVNESSYGGFFGISKQVFDIYCDKQKNDRTIQ